MPSLKIIIVGGGISGLTLANCLQHAGIDFVVLEGRAEIGLHVGAGVGLEPNGDRILDQLGIRGDLLDELNPYTHYAFRDIKGKFMYEQDGPHVIQQRTGYFLWVLERKKILLAMYRRIWEKKKVLLGKRVNRIHYEDSRPVVTCTDGTIYHGDVVVGADGVHSVVRSEMWRLSETQKPGSIPIEDKTYLFSEYRGIYGISDPVEGIESSKFTIVVGVDEVCYFLGTKDSLAWVLAEKLPKKACFPDIPRYTEEETTAFAESKVNKPLFVTNTTKITFGDFWKRSRIASFVSVQEGFLEKWTSGNIVLIGDIVHKGTPETGQGANMAIETAASLANHLKRLTENNPEKLSSTDIQNCLRDFEAHRKPRARACNTKLMENVRALTLSNPIVKFIVEHVALHMGDIPIQEHTELYIGAERVEYLPIPAQSIGTQPFNPYHGIAKWDSRKVRALTALPLLAIALSSLFQVNGASASGYSRGLEFPVYLIWILEAGRSVNLLKPIQWTLLFGFLAHKSGLVLAGNIWFFLYYTWSPVEVYAADDQRLINIRYTRSILPSFALSALIPALITWTGIAKLPANLLPSSSWWPAILLFTVTQRFVMAFMTDTTPHDRMYNLKADLPYIRTITILAAILSNIAFQTLGFRTAMGITSPITALSKIIEDPPVLTIYIGGLVWLALLYGDLKKARMVETPWVSLLLCCASSIVLLGPGSTLLVGWAWREEILATKKHWAAVTKAG